MVILVIPESDDGCCAGGKDQQYKGPWAKVLAVAPGPHTPASLAKLLEEHRVDLPTWVSQLNEHGRRTTGRGGHTGFEAFDVSWGAAPMSVKRRWSGEAVEDMRKFTRQALAKWLPK